MRPTGLARALRSVGRRFTPPTRSMNHDLQTESLEKRLLMCTCNRSRLVHALLLPLLALPLAAGAIAAATQHGGHSGHDTGGHPSSKEERIGDPYLLDADPVSGKKLGPIESQVIRLDHGREFRFAGKETADQFSADPSKFVPAVDAKLIEQQKRFYPLEICVVSGDKLDPKAGSIDFVYGNRLVRLSSKDHQKTFLGEPEKYLGKLDAAVIEKQKASYKLSTCVVSGEKLGGEMGEPIDRVVGNRLVRFCCKSCLKDFGKDPLKYLELLDGDGKAKTGAHDSAGNSANYTCPMHSEVVQDKPGRCPKCGMDLVKKK